MWWTSRDSVIAMGHGGQTGRSRRTPGATRHQVTILTRAAFAVASDSSGCLKQPRKNNHCFTLFLFPAGTSS
jgi:hypothetical protein